MCVDLASGKVVHDIKVFDVAEPQKPEGALNSYASSTPFVVATEAPQSGADCA